jgi:hypothetical protein
VITENFESYDVRSTVMIMYSLARLRLNPAPLVKKLIDSFERNYKDLEPKDTVIFGWSVVRLNLKIQTFISQFRSKHISSINRACLHEELIHPD